MGFSFPWSGIRGWVLLQDPCLMMPEPRVQASEWAVASELWSHLKSCLDLLSKGTSTVSPRKCSYCYQEKLHLPPLCTPLTARPLASRSYPEVSKLFVLPLDYSATVELFSFLTVQDNKHDYIIGATTCTLLDLLGGWSSKTCPPGKTAGSGPK